jgi:hypothetical protein
MIRNSSDAPERLSANAVCALGEKRTHCKGTSRLLNMVYGLGAASSQFSGVETFEPSAADLRKS